MTAPEIKFASHAPINHSRVNYAAGYDAGEAMRNRHTMDEVRKFIRDNSPPKDEWTKGALHALDGLPSVYARG